MSSREQLSSTPAASITHGKVAHDLKQFPVYHLLRNAAQRHAHTCRLFSHKLNGNVMEQLVEEAVTEVLLAHRKHWKSEALMRNVRQALDRIVYRWKKRENGIAGYTDFGVPDAEGGEVDFIDALPDPRDYEYEYISQIDRDRWLAPLREKLATLLNEYEWRFIKKYLDRDEHDPPATSAEKVRFMRLKKRWRPHLKDFNTRWLMNNM
jgi:hypothetical protein